MPRNILVVDDEPLNLDLLEQELADLGYAIDTADGQRALDRVERVFHNSVHWSQNDAFYLETRKQMAEAIVALKKQIAAKDQRGLQKSR